MLQWFSYLSQYSPIHSYFENSQDGLGQTCSLSCSYSLRWDGTFVQSFILRMHLLLVSFNFDPCTREMACQFQVEHWRLKWRDGKFDLTVLTYLYLISWIPFPLDVTDGRYVFIFSALIAVLHSCTFYDASILYKIYSYVPICINRQVVCVYVQLICLVLYCILLSSSLLISYLHHSFS